MKIDLNSEIFGFSAKFSCPGRYKLYRLIVLQRIDWVIIYEILTSTNPNDILNWIFKKLSKLWKAGKKFFKILID